MINKKRKTGAEFWFEPENLPKKVEAISTSLEDFPDFELPDFELNEQKRLHRRILAGAMFKGEAGAYLRQASLTSDNAANLIPSLDDHQAKLYELQQKEEAFIARVNAKLPQRAQVIPYAMIPFQCWTEGPHANFLYNYLEFYPFSPWNLLLMPKDESGEFVLAMKKCPRGSSQDEIEECNSMLGQIYDELKSKIEKVEDAAARGNSSAYFEMPKIKFEAEAAIITLAFTMGKEAVGEESFVNCRSMFFGDGNIAKLV